MEPPDRYTQVWNEILAKLVAQGVPPDRARGLAAEAAAAQILREVRGETGHEPPVVVAVPKRRLRMAKGDALGLIVMGGLSVLVGLMFRDVYNAVGGVLIGAAGVVENAGFRRYVAGQPRARACLVGSQLAVLALVWIYCGSLLLGPSTAANPEAQDLMKQLGADASEFSGLIDNVARTTYLALAAVSLLYQGGLALYYWKKTAV